MSDRRDDDLFLSDIEKLKAKYSQYDLEEEQAQTASEPVKEEIHIEPTPKTEPVQEEIKIQEPIETSVFRDEDFDDERDVFSTTVDAPLPVEKVTVIPAKEIAEEPLVEEPVKINIAVAEEVETETDDFDDLDDDNDIAVIKQGTSLFSASAEKKEKKPKKEKAPKAKKKPKKLLVIILAVAIPVVLWLTAFITDIVLVNKWYTPFFCIETAEYENGSKNFVGLFYKIQFHVEEDGDISGECVPWFIDGPNDKI